MNSNYNRTSSETWAETLFCVSGISSKKDDKTDFNAANITAKTSTESKFKFVKGINERWSRSWVEEIDYEAICQTSKGTDKKRFISCKDKTATLAKRHRRVASRKTNQVETLILYLFRR